jgi:hypothetical protein
MLVKKMVLARVAEISQGDKIAIFGSALIGSLAYTFSDSFWFSAVEGEVYAMSSLFTAIIFWAILKWDEEMMEIQNGTLSAIGYSPDRWILLIVFLLGLAIGVHLLGILVVPAIAYIMYFRYKEKVDLKGIILVGLLSVFVLGFIQEGIIPGTIALASSFEVSFVNSFGLPFYSGSIFFFLLLIGLCAFLIRWARKKGHRVVYTAGMSLIVLLIGYGSFAVIVIRSNANTPLDENDPENLVTLHSYLKREQYGSAPLLFGPHWNSKENGGRFIDGRWVRHADKSEWKDQGPIHLRRFVVVKNDAAVKAFKDESRAKSYATKIKGSTVEEKYYETNAGSRENSLPTYAQSTFFPRMYWNQEARRIEGYKKWSGYDASDGSGTELGTDGKRLPTFGENMAYFTSYQVNWMYWRYFMWNFAGRQNDIQGHGDAMRGNWISGIGMIDEMRLGNQGEFAPYFTKDNRAHNKFFLLPLILGFIGLIFHFYKAPKDAFVIFLAFLFTGVAIVVYLNQKPFEPRERDYAFAGSFYFFAMWIGIGVYALYEAFRSFGKKEFLRIGIVGGAGLLLTIVDSVPAALTWFVMLGIAAALIGLMVALRKVLKSDTQGAAVATALCLVVPVIMGVQGWDDHDRSLKTSAHDLAYNYLNSCEKNGIIFTNGDNDTFPLWYMQEVEGERTDVRVANLSLMQTDWYTDQMKMKAYDSEPLPIKFTEDQILMNAGKTDYVLFTDVLELFLRGTDPGIIKQMIDLRVRPNKSAVRNAINQFNSQVAGLVDNAKAQNSNQQKRIDQIKQTLVAAPSSKMADDVYNKFQAATELLNAAKANLVTVDNASYNALIKALQGFEANWNSSYLADAMAFIRNDDNIVTLEGQQFRVFPSSGFVLPVNVENAVKSGLITAKQKSLCHKELRFQFGGGGISREQVMMLDILANNDWERPIYFSSPGGSEVALALLRGLTGTGYIKQNGMAFELSPLNIGQGSVNMDKMYDNLMKNYSFGAMNNPKVLTDYYARRHTSQYRAHFLRLAEVMMVNALAAEQEHERAQMLKSMNPEAQIPDPSLTKEEIKEYKKKSVALLKRSLEVMPPELVIDHGEPSENSDPRKDFKLPDGRTFKAYNDGNLHEYVYYFFKAGDKKAANELGITVAEQLESIMKYYEKSDVAIAANQQNTTDLYAAVNSYIQLYVAAAESDPEGKLATKANKQVKYLYDTMFPSMMDKLKERANQNGESTRRSSRPGRYASMLFDLQDYTEAMAVSFGLIDAPAVEPGTSPAAQPQPGLPTPGLPGGPQ